MSKVVKILSAVAFAVFAVSIAAAPASAAQSPTPGPSSGSSQSVDQLTQQLAANQAQLDQLTSQVEGAQGKLDLLNRRVAQDEVKKQELSARLNEIARTEYEQPSLGLTTILQARSLSQLLGAVAQARLLSAKQNDVFQESKALQLRDTADRNLASEQLTTLSASRDQASKLAAETQTMLQSAQAQAAQQAAAQAQAAQAQAIRTAANVAPLMVTRPASSQSGGTNPNRFALGNCTWYVASLVYVPWLGNAIDWWPNARAYGYAEGSTPQVGAIMVSAESGYGHVSLVTSVNGGSWTVTEMNYQGYNIVDTRTVTAGNTPVVGFIYGAH